jgi:transcriptional regulator with GAF, ATPase, and Fis domain
MIGRSAASAFSDSSVQQYQCTELARKIELLAATEWGSYHGGLLIGLDASLQEVQEKLQRFAQTEKPVLISGETGTGKELFARALYLLSRRRQRPFIRVNCAQYQDGQLLASELFGHKRGSFTGAVSDHRGIFQEAAGGVVFLDEVGELSVTAQSMLLRVLGEGEIVPVGHSRPIHVDVRLVAATSRKLEAMVAEGTFRRDLYYRLRHFHLRIPPLRERGSDWELLLQYFLNKLIEENSYRKRFSGAALELLGQYHWPGNVRELKGMVETAYHLSRDLLIETTDFIESLEFELLSGPTPLPERPNRFDRPDERAARSTAIVRLQRMMRDGQSFWDVVRTPFLERELSRQEVREIISRGLTETQGSYKEMLPLFGLGGSEYLRFMDFLRHHRLKPERPRSRYAARP